MMVVKGMVMVMTTIVYAVEIFSLLRILLSKGPGEGRDVHGIKFYLSCFAFFEPLG